MSYQNIVNVNVSLQTSPLTRVGFGTPLFAASHRYFKERVRAYTSLTAAATDIPTDSNAYAALQAAFSQSPSPAVVKIGRIEADVTIIPLSVIVGSTHSFNISVNDTAGSSLAVSYTAAALDNEESVVDGFISAISGDVDISAKVTASKVGTGTTATLTLTPVDSAIDSFDVTNLSGVSQAFSATETASAAISGIDLEDSDWYFYATENHTESWVLDTAAAIEGYNKMYFVSTQEVGSLSALASPATDTLGKLFEFAYNRTAMFWHDLSDSVYPEMSYIGVNSPYDAGSVNWSNVQPAGVSAAKDPVTGYLLSATQKGYLFDRNVSTTERIAGLTAVRGGKVASGKFIDTMRGSDDLTATLTVDLQQLLLNQAGSKLPYTDQGITTINAVMQSALQRFVDRGFLESYSVRTPLRAEASTNDIANRDYSVATFTGIEAGAINTSSISGTVTL